MKDNILDRPPFDQFRFFIKHFMNDNNHPMMTFTHNGQELQYDVYTYQFYLFYIKRFGTEFIESQINRMNETPLKSCLQQYLIYTSNYIFYEVDNFIDFCDELSVNSSIQLFLKEYVPFETTDVLAEILKIVPNNNEIDELASVFIAYFYENSGNTERFENFWYYFSKIFTDIYGTSFGIEKSNKIFERANRLLIDYGSDYTIPCQPYAYPETLTYNINIDDFQNEEIRIANPEYHSEHNHIHIGKQIFYKDYMQLFPFYASLRNSQGKNLFEDKTLSNQPIIVKHLELYNFVYENYYIDECQRFKDYLNMIGCEFLYEKLSSYVPVSYPSINRFIQNNYKDGEYEGSFERYTSILLIYWIYDKEDLAYSNTTYVHRLLQSSIEDSVEDSASFRKDWASSIAYSIIQHANNYGGIMNLPLIPTVQPHDFKFRDDGTFKLPWEYVKFQNGYMLLYHPLHIEENKKPFRIDYNTSRVTYNEIRLFFTSNVPLLNVVSKKGTIIKIDKENKLNLDDYVSSIIYRTSKTRIKFEIKRKEHQDCCKIRSYSLGEINKLSLVEKSYYLNELCKIHLSNYKVYNFDELRINSSSSGSESVFCFIIKDIKGQLIVAIENTLESRSTILFFVKKFQLNQALEAINIFFSSGTINKRQSLQWNEVDFKDPSIIKYERIIHTSTWEWNRNIKKYL